MDNRPLDEAALIERVQTLSGVAEPELAQRVGLVVTQVLMEQLAGHDRAWLASALPSAWIAQAAHGQAPRERDSLDDFFQRVAVREGVELGLAREHAQSCCRALAEAWDDDARRHLTSRLSDELAPLFELPEPQREHITATGEGHQARAPRNTLAEGRPTSRTPMSDATTERAQQDSVARSANPHADTKLSSTEGTTQEREAETLAKRHPK